MERLTKRDKYGHWYTNEMIHDRMLGGEPYPHAYDGKPIDKLAEFENAEEQGLLHKFSCRVGDIIYFVTSCDILRKTVINIKIDEDGIEYYASGIVFRDENIGECIFLSEAEAESALAEKGGTE